MSRKIGNNYWEEFGLRIAKLIFLWFICVSLGACVTNTDSPVKKVDTQKALESNVKLGMAYLEKGNRDAALRSFDKALEFDSRSSEAHLGLALVHQLNGEDEIAEAAFKMAMKGRADFSRSTVLFSYGKFLLEQNRLKEAMKYFDKVSGDLSYPSRAQAFYFKGLTAMKMEDLAAAKGAFEYALNLNSGLSAAAMELAAIAFAERDYPQAKTYLSLFVKNSRHTPRSLWLGIRIERVFGNADQEASYALALRNLYPYSREYLEYKRLIGENK